MTITVLPTRNEYTATAGQTVFTYTFKIFESTDLNVYVTPAGQTPNDTTDIITPSLVTGVGDSAGGSITIPATSAGDLVTIVGDIPASRTVDYQNNGDFRPDTVNDDFDRVVSLTKQVEDFSNRTLTFPESQQDASNLSLPTPEAGRLVRWNSGETGLENVDIATPVETVIESIAALRNLNVTGFADGDTINVTGYYTKGDGGGGQFYWDASSTEADNGGTIIKVASIATGRFKRLFNILDTKVFGSYRDNINNDAQSLLNTFSFGSTNDIAVNIPSGAHLLSSSLATLAKVNKIYGDGWNDDGNGSSGSVLNTAFPISMKSTTLGRGIKLSDFYIDYTALGGDALTIDNIIYSIIDNVNINCNGTGARGLVYSNSTYFASLKNVIITSFTDLGILIDSGGTKTVLKDCVVTAATGANPNHAVEIRDAGTSIYDGQIDVANVAGDGIGILFNNISGASIYGGLVSGTLFESNTAIKITGLTNYFGNIDIKNTRHTLGISDGVIFDRAISCRLIDPVAVSPTGGNIVEFTALAIRCGLIGGYDACRSGIVVNALATDCYKVCTEPISYSDRSNITTDSNITTTCNDVQFIGKTSHNGVSWDKFSESIADDGFTTFTPPATYGTMELRTTAGSNEYALVNYDISAGTMVELNSAAATDILNTNGALNGTTGTDGFITVRASSTGVVYVENRRGSARRMIIEFK